MMDIDLDFLRSCLMEAGEMALDQRGGWVAEIKKDNTPVTVVDRQVETFLIDRILERYPRHQILSEESGARAGEAEFTWVIDPIDGTRAFATGLPVWGVSMGVLRGGEPWVGGFYLPVTREMYWGTCEEAYYNDRRLSPPVVDLDSVLHFLAVPSNVHLHFRITYPRIRGLGSAAAHLAYVATGAAVGALTRRVSLWDLAGLMPLSRALGIEMVTLDGEPYHLERLIDGRATKEPLLAALPSVIEPLLKMIQPL